MAGIASRGPVPKRSSQRAGHRAKSDRPDQVAVAGSVAAPPAMPGWNAAARRWYDSLKKSAQAKFFEPSDWEYARLLAELLTKEYSAVKVTKDGDVVPVLPRAAMVNGILRAMSELGTTESSRRRMRIEVDREVEEPEEYELTVLSGGR